MTDDGFWKWTMLSPVVADNGTSPVIDLSLDLCIVSEALAVLDGLAEDGVAVAHEGDLHVAGVLGGSCKISSIGWNIRLYFRGSN